MWIVSTLLQEPSRARRYAKLAFWQFWLCPCVPVCGYSWIATPDAMTCTCDWITFRYRVGPVGWGGAVASRVFLAGLWLVTVGNSVVMAGIGVVTG